MNNLHGKTVLVGSAAMLALAVPTAAAAQQRNFNLPAQPATRSIPEFARQAGIQIVAPGSNLRKIRTRSITGRQDIRAALSDLLEGTGLRVVGDDGRTITLGAASAPEPAPRADASLSVPDNLEAAADTDDGEDIVVTGSHIRGAPIASPVVRLRAEEIRNAGQTNLGQVARSIPQSFGGGQNPGIGVSVPNGNAVNIGGGSTINLRGLGSDATLTLLNGHRLSYTGSRQGVDIASIPLGAVDRLEVVPDGASALYGSDAVAGVANVILKRDYQGIETSARYGTATEGDYSEQQYGAVAGARWGSGGFIAAYEYGSNTRLLSNDRGFARGQLGITLYPDLSRHALILAGHQRITDSLSFEVDGLYNRRKNAFIYPQTVNGDLIAAHAQQNAASNSWAVAPSLKLDLANGWNVSLLGTYGQDRTRNYARFYTGTVKTLESFVCYCNTGKSAELAVDGTAFTLPGGPIKIALGAGYRYNGLNAFRGAGSIQNFDRSQESYYGYGELSVPLVSPAQGIALVERLNVSAALRYERYPGIGTVATPKLGLIYAPAAALDFKLSWGQSFRAPTLQQQYQLRSVTLYPAATLGGTGAPTGATALLITGGNPALKPERASTWTATIDLHPARLAGAHVALSYFSTHYKDRIVTPISFISQSLSNPIYASLVTRNPSAAAQAALIASVLNFANGAGVPYSAANVVAIADDSNINAGSQKIQGVDLLADYRADVGPDGSVVLTGNVSYLTSNQQLFPGQPITPRAGILYNPPHWHGRGGVTWTQGALMLNGTLSYLGGVDDTRTTQVLRVGSFTTLDLTARYRLTDAPGLFKNLEISLTAQNILNDRPSPIATNGTITVAFDSTNYSPVGRFVSLSLAKKW